jgi:hypothetical protein
MSSSITSLKSLRALAALTLAALATTLVVAQAPKSAPAGTTPAAASAPAEGAPATAATASPTKPLVADWKLKKLNGNVNVTVNPDGTYLFSGSFSDKKKDLDFDITFALKSRTGGVYLFHYEGDASNGIQFSRTGESPILKDDFASFDHYKWAAHYCFHLTAAGRRERYEAEQRKLEKIRKEEAEARKRKDEKLVAEKKAEEKAEAKAEMEWEENFARTHQPAPSGGGKSSGGGGVMSDISSAVNTVGSVLGSVGSGIGDVLSSIF